MYREKCELHFWHRSCMNQFIQPTELQIGPGWLSLSRAFRKRLDVYNILSYLTLHVCEESNAESQKHKIQPVGSLLPLITLTTGILTIVHIRKTCLTCLWDGKYCTQEAWTFALFTLHHLTGSLIIQHFNLYSRAENYCKPESLSWAQA